MPICASPTVGLTAETSAQLQLRTAISRIVDGAILIKAIELRKTANEDATQDAEDAIQMMYRSTTPGVSAEERTMLLLYPSESRLNDPKHRKNNFTSFHHNKTRLQYCTVRYFTGMETSYGSRPLATYKTLLCTRKAEDPVINKNFGTHSLEREIKIQ